MFRLRFAQLVQQGEISEADVSAFNRFTGPTGQKSFSVYIMGRLGLLEHMAADEGFQATMRVMDTMGLGACDFNEFTAMPTEEQFWQQFDGIYELTEAEMKRELPNIVTDPSNLSKVNALLEGHTQQIKADEQTRQLAWFLFSINSCKNMGAVCTQAEVNWREIEHDFYKKDWICTTHI